MKQREKTIPPQAQARLIELYTASDKPDEVTKWQTELAKYPAAVSTSPKLK